MTDKRKVEVRRLGIEMEITEEQAFEVLNALRDTFGWAGTEFTRGDVETTLDRPLTEDEWEKVLFSREWEKLMAEQTTQAGWWVVDLILSDVLEAVPE